MMYMKSTYEIGYKVPEESKDALMFAKNNPDWIRCNGNTTHIIFRKEKFQRIGGVLLNNDGRRKNT